MMDPQKVRAIAERIVLATAFPDVYAHGVRVFTGVARTPEVRA